MKRLFLVLVGLGAVALVGLGGTFGANLYYSAGHGTACSDCHEMAAQVGAIHASSHRNAGCTDCHEATMATKLRHVRVHLMGGPPEEIRLREADLQPMIAKCQ